ncbi:hypothetical protein ACOSQ3_016828 [Xanthoceras sorbifolium]
MEEILSSPSCSLFPVPFFQDQIYVTLQQRLQFIVQSRPDWWIFGFLAAGEGFNGQLVLSWGDGHFRCNKQAASSSNKTVNGCGSDVTDCEWYYTVSVTRCFGIGDGVLRRTFSSGEFVWLSVKEARTHEIQTLVCISTACGVVELESSDMIKQDWSTVQLAKSLFESDIASLQIPTHSSNNVPLLFMMLSLKDKPQESEIIVKELTGLGRSSSGSGQSDSDGNFASAYTDNGRSRETGRKPAVSEKETPLNHVEEERYFSLLADAVTYINELKDKIHELENKLVQQLPRKKKGHARFKSLSFCESVGCGCEDRGSEAMIRVQCPDINYPAAKLMDALRDLDFQVHHASVSSVRELMLQDSVVKVPDGIISEEVMRTAIYQMMQN